MAVTYRSAPPPDADDLLPVPCDVTDPEAVDAAFGQVEGALGPVEVLVSNAGINRDGLVLRMSEDDFTSVLDANLTAGFRVAKRAVRTMMRARWGRIIFVSSVAGLVGPGRPGQLRGLEGRHARPGAFAGPGVRVA